MKNWLIFSLRLTLGAVFLGAGASKYFSLNAFSSTINSFGEIPPSVADSLAVIIPSIEVTTGLLLILGLWTRFSVALAMILLALFVAAMIPPIAMGKEIDCGCFGMFSREKVGLELLYRDLVLLCIALILLAPREYMLSLDNIIHEKGHSHG